MKTIELFFSDRYRRYISFRTYKSLLRIPKPLFWLAILAAYCMTNAPKDKVSGGLTKLLHVLTSDPEILKLHYTVLAQILIPVKGLIYFLSFLVIILPLIIDLINSRKFWELVKWRRLALMAFIIFIILSLLVFPYSYPDGLNSNRYGLSGMGIDYAQLTRDPFSENTGWYYRRLLKPSIAYFLQLQGYFLYFIFSLFCTYILIFLSLAFFQRHNAPTLSNQTSLPNELHHLSTTHRFIVYVSTFTSSYIMTDFIWVGYVDHLTFILLLLMAIIPMSSQSRLGIVVLCLLNHESSFFALLPIIIFCFPRKEIFSSLAALFLYLVIWFTFQGSPSDALAVHSDTSVREGFLENIGLGMMGIFFSYKLLWLSFPMIGYFLFKKKEFMVLFSLIGMIISPVILAGLAWDTTRNVGFGILGLLICLDIWLTEFSQFPRWLSLSLLSIIFLNLIVPANTIIANYPLSLSSYPYRGLYQLIYHIFI